MLEGRVPVSGSMVAVCPRPRVVCRGGGEPLVVFSKSQMGPRSHGQGLEMPRPASPSSPTGPLRAACLLPHDSAPLPSTAGLLPPAHSSSLLFRSLRGLPATPAQDAGSQGLQGPGPVPQQDWHPGPVPGHAARVRAGSPGARLPLHAVLSHASEYPSTGSLATGMPSPPLSPFVSALVTAGGRASCCPGSSRWGPLAMLELS